MEEKIEALLKERVAELKIVRKALIKRLEKKEFQPDADCGLVRGRNCKYWYCVWVELPKDNARIALYEDARVDGVSGNFHPGRIGYVTLFKNLKNNGGICTSSNAVDKEKGKHHYIIYNLNDRFETGIRADNEKETLDKIIAAYEKFIKKSPNRC